MTFELLIDNNSDLEVLDFFVQMIGGKLHEEGITGFCLSTDRTRPQVIVVSGNCTSAMLRRCINPQTSYAINFLLDQVDGKSIEILEFTKKDDSYHYH